VKVVLLYKQYLSFTCVEQYKILFDLFMQCNNVKYSILSYNIFSSAFYLVLRLLECICYWGGLWN